jgi:hypothetical protein
VQYSVSVIVNGVVRREKVRTLLSELSGGVRATSVYDGNRLDGV